jgi:hypothetical protein
VKTSSYFHLQFVVYLFACDAPSVTVASIVPQWYPWHVSIVDLNIRVVQF